MKKVKKIITLLLAACLACTMFASVAEAASVKETVYVVSGIKITESGTTKSGKIKYNTAGFITSTNINSASQTIRETLSYDSKNQMNKYVKNIELGTGTTHKITTKYIWKNGLVKSAEMETDISGVSDYTYKYNSKKQMTSCNCETPYNSYTYTYKYKNGRVVKIIDSSGISNKTYKYDKKGNVTQIKGQYSTETRKFTYGSGNRVKTMVQNIGTTTRIMSFTYKKIKVNKAYANAISEQQWRLINCVGNNGAVTF